MDLPRHGERAIVDDINSQCGDKEDVVFVDLEEIERSDEELDEMPNTDNEQVNIDELPVVEDYETGYSSSDEDMPSNYDDFIASSDNLYQDEESGEQVNVDTSRLTLTLGQEWDTVNDARAYLRKYAITNHFEIRYIVNEKTRIRGVCKNEGCPWLCFTSVTSDGITFRLKTLKAEHTCRVDDETRNRMADARYVAMVLEEEIKTHYETMKPDGIIKAFHKKTGLHISYHTAWVARSKVLESVLGNYEESYRMAPELCRQILASNPGSIASCARNDIDNSFTNLCIAFKSFIKDFLDGCRPVIGLDGCFLKGKYGGVCLSAVALDGNNGLFPLAIYICQTENYHNWTRFLEILSVHICEHPGLITFISDRQKGIIQSVANIFPRNPHRFCFRHMYKNFKAVHKGELLQHLSWGAAKAYKEVDHKKWMEQIKKDAPKAYDWLSKNDVNTWARAYFDTSSKCEHITNNATESFNSWILKLRPQPIVYAIIEYNLMMMTMMHKRRKIAEKWDENGLVPRAIKMINKMRTHINRFTVTASADHLYNVKQVSTANSWAVNLSLKSCSCRVWDVSGIPCVHAVSVLAPMRKEWVNYCSMYHSVAYYKKAYAGHVGPMLPMSDWGKPHYQVEPPKLKRPPGRPKVNRRRDKDEEVPMMGIKKRCQKCNEVGHNSRTCKGPSNPPARKKSKKNQPQPPVPPTAGPPVPPS